MLQARRYVLSALEIVSLQTTHERRSHHAREIWIFTECLPESWPHLIPSDIEHRRKTPCDSRRTCLHRGDLGRAFHQRGVPGRGHTDLLREKRRALNVIRTVD